jgi:ribosomal subunit interface protein
MNVRVKSTNYQMTQETSDYLDARIDALQKLLGADEAVSRCEVEVGRDAGNQKHGANLWFAEFHILFPGGAVRSVNKSESINGAIDDAKEEVARQLRKSRKLHIRMWRKSGAAFKRLLRMQD